MIINIAIDDVCPKPGYRILGEETENYLRYLNDKFGAKFDLFVPSNFHHQWPISQHQEWINEIEDLDFVSLNAHGHFHQCKDPKRYGECEFLELQTEFEVTNRFLEMHKEWMECDIAPYGWRNPGWLCSQETNKVINSPTWLIDGERSRIAPFKFDFVAVHYEHNQGMIWNCPTFFGHDGIQQENISLHNASKENPDGMIMFQSHIAGNHNHNVWNQANFEQLRISLDHLVSNFDCEFKTLSECL